MDFRTIHWRKQGGIILSSAPDTVQPKFAYRNMTGSILFYDAITLLLIIGYCFLSPNELKFSSELLECQGLIALIYFSMTKTNQQFILLHSMCWNVMTFFLVIKDKKKKIQNQCTELSPPPPTFFCFKLVLRNTSNYVLQSMWQGQRGSSCDLTPNLRGLATFLTTATLYCSTSSTRHLGLDPSHLKWTYFHQT